MAGVWSGREQPGLCRVKEGRRSAEPDDIVFRLFDIDLVRQRSSASSPYWSTRVRYTCHPESRKLQNKFNWRIGAALLSERTHLWTELHNFQLRTLVTWRHPCFQRYHRLRIAIPRCQRRQAKLCGVDVQGYLRDIVLLTPQLRILICKICCRSS